MNSEYIENCEDEIKIEVKSKVEDLQLSRNRQYAEYFEEDIKEETVVEMNTHTNLVTYTCDICSKSYKSKRYLTQHIQSVHEKVKYPCNLCEYKATQQASLKRHIESVHEKVKYSCNQCGKEFTGRSNLKRHIGSVHKKTKYLCN